MKKLSSKIIAGLMASFIGLSPVMGTQVSAMFNGVEVSQNQAKPIKDCSKDELIEMLPYLWVNFSKAMSDARNACGVSLDAIYAAGDVFLYAAIYTAKTAAGPAGFANSFRRGGEAYELIKDNDITYFQNLVRVLQEQTNVCNNIVRQYAH